MRVAVIDTGFANHHSVAKALETAGSSVPGLTVLRTKDPDEVHRADKMIVPGQGGFKDCIDGLAGGLDEALLERLRSGTPYLGICLGLQALFESSEEAPGVRGLGFFAGQVKRLVGSDDLKIPHMGWNRLEGGTPHPFFQRTQSIDDWFYFVHSYQAVPSDEDVVVATVQYGPNRVTAAVARDNVVATQFHPEKSQAAGLRLLGEFLRS